MTKQDIAESIAERLSEAEQSLDRALGDVAGLLSVLSKTRVEAGLALSYGHDVIEGALKASASLTEGRATLIHVHERLAVYQRHQRVELSGSGLAKQMSLAEEARSEPLRIVSAA
jgi:hypothetical protein